MRSGYQRRDPLASEPFNTLIQESFYIVQIVERVPLRSRRVLDLANLKSAAGTHEILECITYLLGLEQLMCRSRLYVDQWVRVFYSTVWIDPNHEFM